MMYRVQYLLNQVRPCWEDPVGSLVPQSALAPGSFLWDWAHPSRATHRVLVWVSKDHLCSVWMRDGRSCTTRSSLAWADWRSWEGTRLRQRLRTGFHSHHLTSPWLWPWLWSLYRTTVRADATGIPIRLEGTQFEAQLSINDFDVMLLTVKARQCIDVLCLLRSHEWDVHVWGANQIFWMYAQALLLTSFPSIQIIFKHESHRNSDGYLAGLHVAKGKCFSKILAAPAWADSPCDFGAQFGNHNWSGYRYHNSTDPNICQLANWLSVIPWRDRNIPICPATCVLHAVGPVRNDDWITPPRMEEEFLSLAKQWRWC